MSEVVLYHHVQGLTDGVRSFAEELERAGHTVHTPDLFDGRTFDTIDEGIAFAREVGFGALAERGVAAAEAIRPDVVYAGFSFGVMPAQQLAQTQCDAVRPRGDRRRRQRPGYAPRQDDGQDHRQQDAHHELAGRHRHERRRFQARLQKGHRHERQRGR